MLLGARINGSDRRDGAEYNLFCAGEALQRKDDFHFSFGCYLIKHFLFNNNWRIKLLKDVRGMNIVLISFKNNTKLFFTRCAV